MLEKQSKILRKNYTAITEFEVISPVDKTESIGDIYRINKEGVFDFIPNITREKPIKQLSLLFLLDHDNHYRVSKIVIKGQSYIIPKGREKNYAPHFHPSTYKFAVKE